MIELPEEDQADLEALAERDDLRVSKYARAILKAADSGR